MTSLQYGFVEVASLLYGMVDVLVVDAVVFVLLFLLLAFFGVYVFFLLSLFMWL